jgi:hypothetical protein
MLRALWLTTKTVALALLSTVFATTAQSSLHRSALFLIFFLIVRVLSCSWAGNVCRSMATRPKYWRVKQVHMAGNLTALFGRDAYNMYGHHLNSTPGIRVRIASHPLQPVSQP